MASVRKREWTHNGVKREAWVVAYTDQGGKRRLKTFDKKKDADKHRTKVETEVEKGIHTPESESARVSAVVKAFLTDAEARHRERRKMGQSRLTSLYSVCEKYIVPRFGGCLLVKLTFGEVSDWVADLATKEGLGARTARHYALVFKMVVDFGIQRLLASRNVVADVLRARGVAEETAIRTFTREEVQAVLAAAEICPPRYRKRKQEMMRSISHLAVFLGLRKGEILGLTLASLDFDAGVVRVRNCLTAWDELKGPKTKAGVRDVPMLPHIAQMVRDWLAEHYIANPRGLVFRTEAGTAVSAGNFQGDYWRPLLERAGIVADASGEWPHFHALRHWAASSMVAANMPLTDVAEILGHAKFDTTLQIYAHPIMPPARRMLVLEGAAVGLLAPAAA